MAEEDIKWYSSILLLVGAVVSFADPITDILTLVEFYRTDHKTWFYVGLAFVILPCLVFPLLYLGVRNEALSQYSVTRKSWQTLLCGLHPFSAAFARLEGFVYCLRKWRRGDEVDSDSGEETINCLLTYIDMAVLFESVLESAPQLIIQIYAIFVLEKVELIQKISLPISFVSLVWAFTIVDKMLYESVVGVGNLHLGHRVLLFVANLFNLGSRLFVILFFTLLFKWWIVVAMLSHNLLMLTIDIALCCANTDECDLGIAFIAVLYFFLYWLRDDVSLQHFVEDFRHTTLRKMQRISYILFVLENTIMLLACLVDDDMSVKNIVILAVGALLWVTLFTCMRAKLLSCLYSS